MSLIDETVRVRRGGSFLTIPYTSIERYKDKGYEVVDASGNVVKKGDDIESLKSALEKKSARVRELEAQVAELRQMLKEAQRPAEPVPVKTTSKRSTRK